MVNVTRNYENELYDLWTKTTPNFSQMDSVCGIDWIVD